MLSTSQVAQLPRQQPQAANQLRDVDNRRRRRASYVQKVGAAARSCSVMYICEGTLWRSWLVFDSLGMVLDGFRGSEANSDPERPRDGAIGIQPHKTL